ncbi:hypothetical protein PF008_g19735 [Phytophthora fragariae]|uniref:Uncharacterized protein n=1 Tax=Phytophthora fragariae TaxID=53985 RepID=A0A6G0R1I4_9STRA|nr:hypothetical protein PF008_g19735 [Phytophthora fragariae]
MTSSNGDVDRDVDDVPPHAPEQLPITPPIEVGTSGSGGVADTPSDQAGDVPQTDSTVPGEFHSRKNAPEQDDIRPNSEAVPGPPTTGVDLSTIDDPAATAAAFASVGQLLVTQQIISEATAKYIFQGELNLTQSNSAAAAAANPTLPGEVPPSRFGVRQDPSSFVVGIPAKHADRLSERFMREGYGGLETLTFVETLSDEDVRDLWEMTDSRLGIRPELLLPRPADSTGTVSEFRDLLGSLDGRRELASLLQHYPVDGLARKVFRISTLLKRTLEQLSIARMVAKTEWCCWKSSLRSAT